MARVYLGIGSNLGDREANCRKALDELEERGIRIGRVSSLYETEPWGVREQPMFINMAAEADTDLSPREVLRAVKETEKSLGRKETRRWGPRVVDIDILLYNDIVVDDPDLKIPHPHMHERDFVLRPLSEIDPQVLHPVLGKTAGEMLSGE